MDVARVRPILRTAAAVALAVLLTACTLYLLLTRLGDGAAAWWAGRVALLAAVATVTAATALALGDSTDHRGQAPDR